MLLAQLTTECLGLLPVMVWLFFNFLRYRFLVLEPFPVEDPSSAKFTSVVFMTLSNVPTRSTMDFDGECSGQNFPMRFVKNRSVILLSQKLPLSLPTLGIGLVNIHRTVIPSHSLGEEL